ncbi:uncharacterized protein LOC144862058 [Branchiostoma floridae x Branchiostoma japonicum]
MPIGFLLRRAWHLYLFVCGMCFYSAVMKAAVERQLIPRDIIAREFLDKLDVYDTNSEQWRIYPVANEEIFLRAYLRPANETHYSRIVGCDLYRDEHRDTMVKRLTAGGTDPGRVNMANSSDSWRFSYLLHACKHVRLPNFDFDVPPVEEEAPPYHPITWLQLARNIRDWTKDYLREAFAEDPADTYTGEEPRPLMWSELIHDIYKNVVEWFSPEDENSTDAANTLLHPAGNTDPAETDASSVTWSHLWTEMGNKVSGVTAMFLSETPDDLATDGALEIDLGEGKAESQGGTASYFSRTYWPWTTDEETPEPDVQDDPAEPGWSLSAWSDLIFQAKNLMIAQIWADPPVILDDPP